MDDRIAEKLVMALGEALIRKGVLDADDICTAADNTADETVAHLLRCMALHAAAPSQSEWEAARRRARMRVVSSHDGGSEG